MPVAVEKLDRFLGLSCGTLFPAGVRVRPRQSALLAPDT
jgi:hypothetical protein